MTPNEYNKLKAIDTRAVLEKMHNAIEWVDSTNPENDLDGDAEHILACFIMWKIKNTDHHNTIEEYYKYCIGNEQFEDFDDILGFLEDTRQWDLFVAQKDNFTDEELKAVVLFNGIDPAQEGILSLIDRIFDIKDTDHIIEYFANDFEFSMYSAIRHRNNDYSAYEDTYGQRGRASCRAQMMDLPKVSIMGEFELIEKCDKAFINGTFPRNTGPLYAMDEFEAYLEKEWKTYPKGKNPIWDVCSSVYCSVKSEGQMIALIDAGQLCGKDSEKTREFLINSKCIKGVIALPEKMFRTTWVSAYILIMQYGSETIRFCDAREKYDKGRIKGKRVNQLTENFAEEIYEDFLNGEEYSRTISVDEVKRNDYILLPQRYIITNLYKESFKLDNQIYEINRGISLSADQIDKLITDENTGTKCIMPSSLSNGIIEKSYYFREKEYNNKKNYASRGDLLINKTGKPIHVAVADNSYIVIGNTYIIKLKNSKIDPYYIKCFLESRSGQQEIEKFAVGAKTPLISVSNLRKLEIPIFGSKKQKRVEQQAKEITEDLQRVINEMSEMSEIFD